MSGIGPRAGGLRLIRIMLVAVGVGTVINSAGMVLLFVANAARVEQIQQERAANIHRNCEDINLRHDRTIRRLDELLARRLKVRDPERLSDEGLRVALRRALDRAPRDQRAQIKQSRASTVLLIDPLVPVRECDELVRETVGTG